MAGWRLVRGVQSLKGAATKHALAQPVARERTDFLVSSAVELARSRSRQQLGVVFQQLEEQLESHADGGQSSLDPQQLCDVAWACGRRCTPDAIAAGDPESEKAWRLLGTIGPAVASVARKWSDAQLGRAAWAYARGTAHPAVSVSLSQEVSRRVEGDPRGFRQPHGVTALVNMAWAAAQCVNKEGMRDSTAIHRRALDGAFEALLSTQAVRPPDAAGAVLRDQLPDRALMGVAAALHAALALRRVPEDVGGPRAPHAVLMGVVLRTVARRGEAMPGPIVAGTVHSVRRACAVVCQEHPLDESLRDWSAAFRALALGTARQLRTMSIADMVRLANAWAVRTGPADEHAVRAVHAIVGEVRARNARALDMSGFEVSSLMRAMQVLRAVDYGAHAELARTALDKLPHLSSREAGTIAATCATVASHAQVADAIAPAAAGPLAGAALGEEAEGIEASRAFIEQLAKTRLRPGLDPSQGPGPGPLADLAHALCLLSPVAAGVHPAVEAAVVGLNRLAAARGADVVPDSRLTKLQLINAHLVVARSRGATVVQLAHALRRRLRAHLRRRAALQTHESETQHRVRRWLDSNGVASEGEAVLPGSWLLVDFAVRRRVGAGAERLAVEVNGPLHYDHHGRLLARDVAKAALITATGWRFVTLPYWEVDEACRACGKAWERYMTGKLGAGTRPRSP